MVFGAVWRLVPGDLPVLQFYNYVNPPFPFPYGAAVEPDHP